MVQFERSVVTGYVANSGPVVAIGREDRQVPRRATELLQEFIVIVIGGPPQVCSA